MNILLNSDELGNHPTSDPQGGSVLLFTLVCMVFVSVIGFASLKIVSSDAVITTHYKRNTTSFYLAEAGIEKAKAELKNRSLYDIYHTSTVNSGVLYPSIPFGDGLFTVALKGDFNPGFQFDQNKKTIKTTKKETITIKALTAQFSYKCSHHCEIGVYAWISFDNGYHYKSLFSGKEIDGGETNTFEHIRSGSPLQLMVLCADLYSPHHYHFNYYDYYYTSYAHHKNRFVYLKAGDPAPTYFPWAQQIDVHEVLKDHDLIDEQNRIKIKNNDLLVLVDLDDNPLLQGDYQDLVLLFSFGTAEDEKKNQNIVVRSTGRENKSIEESIEVILKKSSYDSLEVVTWREVN